MNEKKTRMKCSMELAYRNIVVKWFSFYYKEPTHCMQIHYITRSFNLYLLNCILHLFSSKVQLWIID